MMGNRTAIAWADSTFNPWLGCARVSPGCDHCYAEAGSKRFAAQHGLKLWDGDRHVTSDSYWREPLKWERLAAATGQPHRVFCGSWCDWAEDHNVARATRPRLLDLIYRTPHLTWMLLTKRPENIREALHQHAAGLQMDNIWLGTTCEDQARLDARLPHLMAVPASVHFLSCEPLLEGVTIREWLPEWVIVGGESGPKARPFAATWARRLRDESDNGHTRFFCKQFGSVWARAEPGRHPHGADPSEWSEDDLRVQEFPA